MKAVVGAFNQEKALVGAFSVIVQPVVEPMDRFAALLIVLVNVERSTGGGQGPGAGLGGGQVFFSCNGQHMGRRFKEARRNTKPSNN